MHRNKDRDPSRAQGGSMINVDLGRADLGSRLTAFPLIMDVRR